MNMEKAKALLFEIPCKVNRTACCKSINKSTPIEVGSVFLHTTGNTFVIDKIEGTDKLIRFIGGVKPYSKWTNAAPKDIRRGGLGNPYYAKFYKLGYPGEYTRPVDKTYHSFARKKWMGIFIRLHHDPNYTLASITPEFRSFAFFHEWINKYLTVTGPVPKDWELDKDLLGDGFIYSAESCCLIPGELNRILVRLNLIYEYQYRAEHLAVYLDKQMTLPIGAMSFETIIRKVATRRLENVKRDLRKWEERFTYQLPTKVMHAIRLLQNKQVEDGKVQTSAEELKKKFLNTDKKEVKYRLEFLEKFQSDNPVEIPCPVFRSLLWTQDTCYATKGVNLRVPYVAIKLRPFGKICRINKDDFNTFRSRALAVLMLRVKTFNDINVLTEEELFERLRNYYGYDDKSLKTTFDTICGEHDQ